MNEGWWRQDLWLARARDKQLSRFVSDRELLSEEELSGSSPYRDLFASEHIQETIGTLIPLPQGEVVVFRLLYDNRQPRLTLNERHSLERLRPHLERSIRLAAQLNMSRAQAAATTLEALNLPAAVFASDGRVLAVNPSLESLRPGLTIARPSGLVTVADGVTQRLLDAALSKAIEGHGEREFALPLRVPGRLPAVLHLLSIPHQSHDIFPVPAAVLVETAVGPLNAPPSTFLQALFALTPAESRVTQGLAEGKTLEELASQLNVSRETLRTQLRSVFAKTGAKRQAELATILASASFLTKPSTVLPTETVPDPGKPEKTDPSARARRKPKSPR